MATTTKMFCFGHFETHETLLEKGRTPQKYVKQKTANKHKDEQKSPPTGLLFLHSLWWLVGWLVDFVTVWFVEPAERTR